MARFVYKEPKSGIYDALKDDELVEFLKNRKASPQEADDAAREIQKRYGPLVRGICGITVGRKSNVDDAVQETFEHLIRNLDTYEPEPSNPRRLGPWLAAIARNTSAEMNRKVMRDRAHLETDLKVDLDAFPDLKDLTPEKQGEVKESVASLFDGLASLDNKSKTMIQAALDGKSYREISSELMIPMGTVKSRMHSSKKKLKDRIN
jgi:RNA polymerase sigma-70 factor, ECF subfamily